VRFGALALPFLLVAGPWTLYTAIRWPEIFHHELAYTLRHLSATLEGHGHAASWYLERLPLHMGGWPLLTWALYGGSFALSLYWLFSRGDRRVALQRAMPENVSVRELPPPPPAIFTRPHPYRN